MSTAVPRVLVESSIAHHDHSYQQNPAAEEHSWHVLHVRSNYEKRVANHLAACAVENYLPLYKERVKWTDRVVVAEKPLFSGYVFARYLPDAKMAVITTPGVVRSLGDDERDLVSCAAITKIREGLLGGLPLRPHPNVTSGARVRIHNGIFAGVEGIVTEARKDSKVIIALASVRLCFSLDVDAQDFEVIDPSPGAADYAGWQ